MTALPFRQWYRRQSKVWADARTPEMIDGRKLECGRGRWIRRGRIGVSSFVGVLPGDAVICDGDVGFAITAGVAGDVIDIDVTPTVWSVKKIVHEEISDGATVYWCRIGHFATANEYSRGKSNAIIGCAVESAAAGAARVHVRLRG